MASELAWCESGLCAPTARGLALVSSVGVSAAARIRLTALGFAPRTAVLIISNRMRFVRARAFVFFSLTGAVGAAELIAPPDLPGLNGEEGITKWVVQGKVFLGRAPELGRRFRSVGWIGVAAERIEISLSRAGCSKFRRCFQDFSMCYRRLI